MLEGRYKEAPVDVEGVEESRESWATGAELEDAEDKMRSNE